MATDTLTRLEALIAARRHASPDESYSAKLLQGKKDKLLKKIGEEAVEVVIAAAGEDRRQIIYESGDLLYHLMVLWARENITLAEIDAELARRFAVSGLVEKASRTDPS